MNLQVALLLIGLVIIAGIALSTYDKARVNRRFQETRKRSGSRIVGMAREALDKLDQTFRSGARLDINPGPLRKDGVRLLRPDEKNVPELPAPDSNFEFYESLEGFEQAASMQLESELNQLRDPDDPSGGDAPFVSRQRTMPDARIDFIINLPGAGPIRRDRALGVYKQNEYMLDKPRSIYGLRYIEGIWSSLDSDPDIMQYSDLSIALQLADRHGPVTESELNTFGQLGLKLADQLKRPCKHAMSYEQAVERASELDAFCKQYDAIAGINVVPENTASFNGPLMDKVLQQQGMKFGAMHIYHKKNDEAMGCRHMYSMANLFEPGTFDVGALERTPIRGLAFFMQIPCTWHAAEVFEDMINTARVVADALGGQVVDQDSRPLTAKGTEVILRQVRHMVQGMQEAGVAPGSETALRLFEA